MLRAALLFAILTGVTPAAAGDLDTAAGKPDTAERGTSPASMLSVLAFAIVIATIVRPLVVRDAAGLRD